MDPIPGNFERKKLRPHFVKLNRSWMPITILKIKRLTNCQLIPVLSNYDCSWKRDEGKLVCIKFYLNLKIKRAGTKYRILDDRSSSAGNPLKLSHPLHHPRILLEIRILLNSNFYNIIICRNNSIMFTWTTI